MYRVLGISTSGYYAWRSRKPSKRAEENQMLTERIREIHRRSGGTYGASRIHAELQEMSLRVGEDRVARLMRAAGLRGVTRRKRGATTTSIPLDTPAPEGPWMVTKEPSAISRFTRPRMNVRLRLERYDLVRFSVLIMTGCWLMTRGKKSDWRFEAPAAKCRRNSACSPIRPRNLWAARLPLAYGLTLPLG